MKKPAVWSNSPQAGKKISQRQPIWDKLPRPEIGDAASAFQILRNTTVHYTKLVAHGSQSNHAKSLTCGEIHRATGHPQAHDMMAVYPLPVIMALPACAGRLLPPPATSRELPAAVYP
jgi:hypothetical protein